MSGEYFVPVAHWNSRLSAPCFSLPSMPHAIAVRIGGMKNGNVSSTSNWRRPGVSVRATTHAMKIAVAIESVVLRKAMPVVLARMRKFSAVHISR